MPYYYAITKPLVIKTNPRNAVGVFDLSRSLPITHSYIDLIKRINAEQDLELFTTLSEARHTARPVNIVEPGTITANLVQDALASPVTVGAKLLTGQLRGPICSKVQAIVIKLFAFTSLVPLESSLPELQFQLDYYQGNIHVSTISKDHRFYLVGLYFQGKRFKPLAHYPTSYEKLLNPDLPPVQAVANLLHDYHAPWGGLFLSGHWNRHHTAFARQLATAILAQPEASLELLVAARKELLAKECQRSGSFYRRINCAIDFMLAQQDRAQPQFESKRLTR